MRNVTITAAGLLVNGSGEVLLGRRAGWKKAWPDHWDAIGGHVEAGESVDCALAREVLEEIGVTVQNAHTLAVVENPGPTEGHIICSHIFAVTSWIGNPENVCDEHTKLRWFSHHELVSLERLAGRGYPELAAQAIALRKIRGGTASMPSGWGRP